MSVPFEQKEETFIIPARTISQMQIKVANPELKEGYIPRLEVTEGIYLEDALQCVMRGHIYE